MSAFTAAGYLSVFELMLACFFFHPSRGPTYDLFFLFVSSGTFCTPSPLIFLPSFYFKVISTSSLLTSSTAGRNVQTSRGPSTFRFARTNHLTLSRIHLPWLFGQNSIHLIVFHFLPFLSPLLLLLLLPQPCFSLAASHRYIVAGFFGLHLSQPGKWPPYAVLSQILPPPPRS